MEQTGVRAAQNRRAVFPAFARKAAGLLAAGLTGFFLSGVTFEGDFSPFAAAFTAGTPEAYLLPAGLGAAAGAFVFCPPMRTLKYVGAVMLTFLFRFASSRLIKNENPAVVCPAVSFLSVFLSAAAVVFVQSPDAQSVLLAFCESLIAGAAAAFWRRVFVLLPGRSSLFAASPGDTAAFLFCGSLLLLSFTPFCIGDFSPARTVCFFLLMLFCLCAGETAGAATGVCAGLLLGFAEEQPHLIFALPAAGLLCGICRSMGKFAVAAAFLVCDTLFLVLKGNAEAAFIAAIEAGVAALMLVLLPERFFSFAGERLRPFSKETCAGESRALLRLRLARTAGAVCSISDAVSAVCRLLTEQEDDGAKALASDARAAVCESCPKKNFCWDKTDLLTRRDFASAGEAVIKNGRLFPETVPQRLQTVCRTPNSLADAFNEAYAVYAARRAVKSEIYDLKQTAAAQFRTVSGLLLAAAAELAQTQESEPYLKALVKGVFDAENFPYTALSVTADESGRLTAELACKTVPADADYNSILEKLYAKTNVRFLPPVFSELAPEGTAVTFCEKTALRVQFFKQSVPAGAGRYCGDACEGFSDGKGNFCCVISDGMGTGAEAAVNASMTCALTAKLLRAGFGTDVAVTAVNSALLVNASEEMLATADICRVDLQTGNTDFFKAGGAASVIKLGAKTAVIEKASLPLGIMRETKFERTQASLSPGDLIVMMSDGADLVPRAFYKELFYRRGDADAKELVSLIIKEAQKRAPIGHADDITVACLRILEQ